MVKYFMIQFFFRKKLMVKYFFRKNPFSRILISSTQLACDQAYQPSQAGYSNNEPSSAHLTSEFNPNGAKLNPNLA